MIHLYCGDGKGKTTAAMGLALRAAGHGKKVVVAQFLKAGGSGERTILAGLPTVELLPVPEQMTFTFRMTPEERAAESARERALLEEAFRRGGEADVLVLDELCAAAHLKKSAFLEAFRRVTGTSPGQYRMQLRLERARDLLLDTDLPVAQVAAACGFSDPFYFSRCFSRHFSVSPSRWRAEHL